MNNALASFIKDAKSILVLLPTNPHFDQVAAGLSLYLSIRHEGKDATISCPSPMVVEFNRLVGVDKVASELGNKNLIVKFKNYPVEDLEKVSYEIEGGEIKIKVEPKPGVNAPSREQVDLSYAGVSADTVILIGGAHSGHFPAISQYPELSNARLVHIGNREASFEGLSVSSLSRPASSISELMTNLLKESSMNMDSDVATNLLSGIEEGSHNFTSNETSADTFLVVSDLMRSGGRRSVKMDKPDRRNFPPGSIPSQPFAPRPQPKTFQPKPYQPRPQNVAQQTQNVESPIPQAEPQAQPVDPEPEPQEIPESWLEPKIYKGSDTPAK